MGDEAGDLALPPPVEEGDGDRAQARRSRTSLRFEFHIILLMIDFVGLVASFLIAFLLYPVSVMQPVLMLATVIPVYFTMALAANAYSVGVSEDIMNGITRSLNALMSSAAVVLFFAFVLKFSDDYSRIIFCLGFVTAAIVLTLSRYLMLRYSTKILGGNAYNIGLITENPATAAMRDAYSVILDAASFDPNSQSPYMYHSLALALNNLDRVVLDCRPEERLVWAHALQGANVSAEIIAPELAEIAPHGFGRFGQFPTIVVARGPLGLFDRATKRGLDLSVAVVAIALLAPLFMLVALVIRLETPGPVFFLQDRIGRGNRIFKVWKFRSMRVSAADGAGHTSTLRSDNRITRVGRLIRAASIDELPQLINVLRGDMSIVGPRPHALGSRADGKLFWEIDGRYWHRHASRPGITGLAQVRGYRGATMLQDDLHNRLSADLEYLRAWSIWLDIKIMLMTFGVIVHKNAF